jgi:pimeloyl-ACP methyl ester carboxylesterase
VWGEVAAALIDVDVCLPDLVGCGGREVPTQSPDLAVAAHDVVSQLDAKGIEQFVLGGISLGGYVAMELVRQIPNRIQGLILVDTKSTADSDVAKANRERIAEQMQNRGQLELFAENMVTTLLGKTTNKKNPELVAQTKAWIKEANPKAVAWLSRAMATRIDSEQTLIDFDRPVLLIRGEEDVVSTSDDFDLMQELLLHAIRVEISGSGHLPPLEQPQKITQAMQSWLGLFN